MSAFELSPRARIDLLEIWERIARDDIDTADRVVAKIEDTIRLIASRPRMGHPRRELLPDRFLFHSVYSWQIIYAPDSLPLRVYRIWHGAQEKPEIPDP